MIVINKSDLLDEPALQDVTAEVEAQIRPSVKLLAVEYGEVDPRVLLGIGAAAEDDLDARPSHHDDVDDHDHDDFTSFSVEMAEVNSVPRLVEHLQRLVAAHGILRIKGFVAVAQKDMRLLVQAVGSRIQHYYDRDWLPEERRGTRLVVIGERGLDEIAIRQALAEV